MPQLRTAQVADAKQATASSRAVPMWSAAAGARRESVNRNLMQLSAWTCGRSVFVPWASGSAAICDSRAKEDWRSGRVGSVSEMRMPMMRNGSPAERRVMALDLLMMRPRFSASQVFGSSCSAGSVALKQRVQSAMKEGETAEKAPRCRILANWARSSSPPVSKSRCVSIESASAVYGALLRIVPRRVLFGGQ